MTFYRLGGQMREISLDEISDEFITAAYKTAELRAPQYTAAIRTDGTVQSE